MIIKEEILSHKGMFGILKVISKLWVTVPKFHLFLCDKKWLKVSGTEVLTTAL